mgnify:CR=1 FL=1
MSINIPGILLITVVLFALGVLILPSTTSLFAGQHFWYDLSCEKSVPCVKCHADVYDELQQSANHSMVDKEAGLDGSECLICHRANASITYAEVSGDYTSATPGKEAHAATVINCGCCHFNSTNPFNAPIAGGFGQSDFASNPGNDTGINASHYSFVVQSTNSNLLHEESESCIACHTTVNVTMNFTSVIKAKIVVNDTYDSSQSYWDVENIGAVENRVYHVFVPDKTEKGSYEVIQ